MKSAYAEMIGAFFAKGGTVTVCPPGNGLGDPALRVAPRQVVGQAKSDSAGRKKIRALVIAALENEGGPLTLLGIEKATGVSFDRLRGAMKALERDRVVTARAGGSNGRTRFFSLTESGAGVAMGGPASTSTADAGDRQLRTSAVRPGKAAA